MGVGGGLEVEVEEARFVQRTTAVPAPRPALAPARTSTPAADVLTGGQSAEEEARERHRLQREACERQEDEASFFWRFFFFGLRLHRSNRLPPPVPHVPSLAQIRLILCFVVYLRVVTVYFVAFSVFVSS